MKVDNKRQADLYIATRSDRSDIVKVGRSCDVKRRCAALSASQCFKVCALYIYPGCGDHEKTAHHALERYRIEGGSGTEWFQISAVEAKDVVDRLLPSKRQVDNAPSYGYELMMAELGMGPYPSEPPPSRRRRISPSRRRRTYPYEAYVDTYRPPRTSAEVLREICLSRDF